MPLPLFKEVSHKSQRFNNEVTFLFYNISIIFTRFQTHNKPTLSYSIKPAVSSAGKKYEIIHKSPIEINNKFRWRQP